jgi:Rrf2 family protein
MITRKTDYAIRCVLHLAASQKEVVMVNEIARERDIPKSFLAKILQNLAKAGIVQSSRGLKGGFRLARKAEAISLLDVVESIEGPVSMNICAVDKKKCIQGSTCSVHPVWVDIRADVENRLKGVSFEDLTTSKKSIKK